jgi:bifunctional non-homologous end joining protein LigD
MTDHVPFLAKLPVQAVLVALDADGKPDFPWLCEERRSSIPLTLMVLDVLSVDGEGVAAQPYSERRRIVEDMRLDGPQWRPPEVFDDAAALWEAVCEYS